MSEKVDNPKLAQIIENCFLLSMDNRLTTKQQDKYGALAEHLRAQLMICLSKTFDDGTPALLDANKKIKAVNADLKKTIDDLTNIADTLDQLAKLVSVIDGLLKIPLGLV